MPADSYTAPAMPPTLTPSHLLSNACSGVDLSSIPFGQPLRSRFFLLDSNWLFLNHGAFGAACRVGLDSAHAWSRHCECQPLRFIDRSLFPLILHSLRLMAARVSSRPTHVVFTPNATMALNVAIAAAGLGPTDVVFALDIGYGSVKKMLTLACSATGATLIVARVRFPLVDATDLIAQVEASMPARMTLAVFDHITSNTALTLPVAELTRCAQQRGARVIVDGAHALQSVDLNIPAVGAEWYVTNGHKWFASPKGVALLAVSDSVKAATRPIVVSHGYGSGFTSDFIWDGCRDYSPLLALPTLAAWWDAIGPARAREHCTSLCQAAIDLLLGAWGTSTHGPRSMYSHMACVALPQSALPHGARGGVEATSTHAKMVQDALHYGAQVEVPVKCLDGVLYLRISAAVYNDLSDFQRLADIVCSLTWDADTNEAAFGVTAASSAPRGGEGAHERSSHAVA